MTLRRLVLVTALLAALLVPSAPGRALVLSATGVITGPASDGYVTLKVTNTGDEAIHCFRIAVPTSVKVASARSISPDWQLISSSPPPSPDIGARALGGAGLQPGQMIELVFRTDPAYPPNVPATLIVSASAQCAPYVSAPVTGPDPPPPPPKPCKCAKLDVKLDPTLLAKKRVPASRSNFGVGFEWNMKCSKGDGGCSATVAFRPPEILAGSLPKPRGNFNLNVQRKTFLCKADCGKAKIGRFEVKMKSSRQLNQLFGRTLAYSIVTSCGGQTKTINVNVAVDQKGRMRLER